MIDSQDNGWGAGEVPISLAYVKDPPSKCSPKILLIDRISDRRSNGLRRWRLCLACEQMICELARACANKAQTTSNVTSNERVFRPILLEASALVRAPVRLPFPNKAVSYEG